MPASLSASTISGQISWWRRTYSSSYPGLTSRTHAYWVIRPPLLAASDFDEFQVQKARDLAQRAGVVADAEGAVVRRSLLAPGVHESRWRQREPQAAVGISDPQRRPRQRLPLGCEHLEVALAGLGYGEDGDRPSLDAELHGDPVAGLAVVDPQPTKDRCSVADGDVPGAVVAHQYKALVEVHHVELGEGTSGSQGVHNLHRDGVLEVTLPGGRDAARREQRVAEYKTGAETLVGAAAGAPVVVGEGVKPEVFGESVDAHGDAGRPLEVSLVHSFVQLEGLARLFELGGDGFFGDVLHAILQVIHLEDLDVEPELGLVHGEVRVHVEHAGVGVAQEAEAATAQRSDHRCGVAPLFYIRPGVLVVVEGTGDDVEGDGGALEGVGDLGHAARRAVREPLAGVRVRVIE